MALGALVIDIAANTAKFSTDMDKAVHIAESVMKRIESVAGTVGIGFGANEFREFIAGSIEAADAAGKAAQKIGTSVENYSALAYAAKLADVGNEEFTQSMIKLDKAMSEAAQGSKEQVAAFADIGVKIKDSTGALRDPGAVLLDIATKFASVKDGAAKSAEAQILFGKSGAQMIPLLNQGGAAIKNLGDEAARTGIVITKDMADGAETFNDSLTKLKSHSEAFGLTLGSALLPTLNNITSAMLDMANSADGGATAGEVLSAGLKIAATIGAEIALTFRDAGDALGAYAAAFVAFVHGNFKEAGVILDESTKNRDAMIAQTDQFIKKVWDEPAEAAKKSAEATGHAVDQEKKDLDLRARAALEAAQKAEEADKKRVSKIREIVTELERQAATVGESTAANKVYELQQLKATDADIKRARAAQKVAEEYKKSQEEFNEQIGRIDRANQLRDEALTPEQRSVQELIDKYAELDEMVAKKAIGQHEADKTKSGLGKNFTDQIDDTLKTDEERLKDSYDRRQAMLDQAHDDGLISEEKYQQTLAKLRDRYEAESMSMRLQNAQTLTEQLAGIAEAAAGKQSGIYRVLFGASKAFALADSIVKIQAGIANAAATPFPANLAAMASVAAATGSILTTIKGAQMGQAHAGLGYVPEDATYVLKQGERVLAPKQNQDLTNYLAKGADGSGIVVNIIEDASRAGQVNQNDKQVDIFVARVREAVSMDIARGGTNISRALESTYGLNRGVGAKR